MKESKLEKINGKFQVTRWNCDEANSSFEGTRIRAKGLLYMIFGQRFRLGKSMENSNTCFDHMSHGILGITPPVCKIGVLIGVDYNYLRELYNRGERAFECEYIFSD
jgi:hypothetical protein